MKNNDRRTITEVVTKESLIEALRSVGVGPNMILEVHSSLSSFGYVSGGARTVVDALLELEEEGGTILMPTQTADNSDPSGWKNPPAAPQIWDQIRESMPAYDAELTDVQYMGDIVENFRNREGTVCSNHPNCSYTAWGRYAKLLCNRQSVHFPLAEESPSARLYELKGYVLLLGTDFDKVTSLHLAEYRTECRPIVIDNACMMIDGRRQWKKYLNLDIDSSDFNRIGESLAKKGMISETMLCGCRIRLFSAAAAIDEATDYFEKNSIFNLYR
ncbi:MAG: AAC(3) family N-acetyltransferase [Solobacterium sp.]|nr:AAC(3) family N-acetyltransferase [Solobacterium sp.]